MPRPSVAETIETHGCSIVLRRVDGPVARELFLHCQPLATAASASQQAEAAYCALLGVLEAEGGSFRSVVSETLFFRDLRGNLATVRAARARVVGASTAPAHAPAVTEVEQPPVDERALLAISVQALLPRQPVRIDTVAGRPACGCAACARARGLRVQLGEEQRLYASGLYGRGANAHEQTLAMFAVAEDLLQQAGMDFGDVVRTWIHLRDMDRDYADLNRARRAFFAARGIELAPASTGIGGGLVPEGHDLSLAVYAVQAQGGRAARTAMRARTLNEASAYGSDFSRGIRMAEANKIALHVSGTASIDEAGRTAHPGDFEAQADRMLVNLTALLEGQGARFADVVSAITYLKRPADAARLREKLRAAGFEGFPNALVVAPICRPELLCEVEALAVPGAGASARSSTTLRS